MATPSPIPQWVALSSSILIQMASGSPNLFPLFSLFLKTVLHLKQLDVAILGFFNDLGWNSAIVAASLISNSPRFSIAIGSVMCFFGYGVLWLATIHHLPYSLLCIAILLAGNSSTWLTTAVFETNMQNFPHSTGIVTRVLKAYTALGTAVFAVLYSTVLNSLPTSLLLLLAFGIPIISGILLYWVRTCRPASGLDPAEGGYLSSIQVSCVALGVYLLSVTVLTSVFSLGALFSNFLVVIMLVLLVAPFAIPAKISWHRTESSEIESSSTSDSQVSSQVESPLRPSSSIIEQEVSQEDTSDFNIKEALVRAEFWLLFVINFIGVGSAVFVITNLAQIGNAQGSKHTEVLLSIFCVCNSFGRLAWDVTAGYYLRTRNVPCAVMMTLTEAIMVFVHLMFASALPIYLYIGVVLMGFLYGGQQSAVATTTSEIFGLRRSNVIYNLISLGNPFCALIISSWLAAHRYDKGVGKQQKLDSITSNVVCLGPSCFALSFRVLAGLCTVGFLLGIVLVKRTTTVYRRLNSVAA